jgi:hypothetical protein
MQPGDRIAVKRMLGKGSPNIAIRALGIIREIDPIDHRVYVEWLVKDLSRQVPSKGAYKSIHGPYKADSPWTKRVFCL